MTDYTDLKRRLESGDEFDSDGFPYADLSALHSDAIAAIAALEAEVARLREAVGYLVGDMVADNKEDYASVSIARAALVKQKPNP